MADANKVTVNGELGQGDNQDVNLGPEELRKIGEETVDEVLSLAQKAESVKEHDAVEDEQVEAKRIQDELDKELEENDGWVKILGNDELMKKVITKGHPNQNPTRGDICTLRVVGKLSADESVVFQNDESTQIQLGDGEVIPGLDLTIPLMTRGEVAIIKVSQRFGFGSKGLEPLVPPSADLIFEVELLNSEAEKELSELSVSERREIGDRKRKRGNWWINRDEISLAVNCYRRALEFLDDTEGGIQFPNGKKEEITPEVKKMFDERLTVLNNLALAQLKLQSYEPALNSVEAVLKCQPNNVKALFRKGKILGEKGDTEKALDALLKAQKLEPGDKGIREEIAKLSERKKKEHLDAKQLYRKMFQESSSSRSSSTESNNGGRAGGSSLMSNVTLGIVVGSIAIALAGVMAYRYY